MTTDSYSKQVTSELSKAKGVDINEGVIRLRFPYRGMRCGEYLPGLKVTGNSIKFASNKRAAIMHEISIGTFNYRSHFPTSAKADLYSPRTSGDRTVITAVEIWLEIQEVKKAKSTMKGYRSKGKRVKEKFGERPIAFISGTELEQYQAELITEDRLNPKTVNDIFTVVRGIFRAAKQDRIISENPCEAVTNFDTSERDGEADPFTLDEQDRILKQPTNRRSELNLTLFNCWVGLSSSELLAMAWEDIDTKRWTVKVRRALVTGEFKVPKEKSRRRTVEILHPARKYLMDQMEVSSGLQPISIAVTGRNNRDIHTEVIRPVWTNSRTDRYFSGDNAISARFLKTHLRKAGVPYRGLNQTRHTFASQMLTNYVSKDWIINQLGHKNYDMLTRHYAKFIPDDTPLLANIVGQQLGYDMTVLEDDLVQRWSSEVLKFQKS